MKIGFIGCGNMASAIISGIINNGVNKEDVFGFDVYSPALQNSVDNFGINACSSEDDVVLKSDIVFLSVKPNVISNVIEKINDKVLEKQSLIISIAAGKNIDYLTNCFTGKCKIVRVMPNINAKVSEAISAYCFNELVTDDDKKSVEKLLTTVGKVLCLDEQYFPLFGVIGGCGPAFAYMFIDALARAGVKNGMKKDDALKIAAQTVLGSAKMILESDEHPWKLIDNVCSPGGTTIEGVTSLQADGFESAIHNAVDKALDKDKKL